MGQSNEPDPIEWASTAAGADIVEPPLGNKQAGWAALDTPPYSWVNWIYYTLSSWSTYFAAFLTTSSDSYVISGLEVTEIPNSTQVNVAAGVAVANGVQVELLIAAVYTLPSAPINTPSEPRVYSITLDATGTIGQASTSDGSGIEETLYVARRYARRNEKPAKAVLALVVDQGQTNYDTANIYDARQFKPVTSAIMEDASIDQNKMVASVVRPLLGIQDDSVVRRVEIPLELASLDKVGGLGVFATPSFRSGDVNLWIKMTTALNGANVFLGVNGYDFTAMEAPDVTIGIAVRRAADAAGTAIALTWTAGGEGGLGFWSGSLDPEDLADPSDTNDFIIELHRDAGQSARTIMLEVGSDHGVSVSLPYTLPST